MKKVLSLVLAIMMVLSLATVAFAETKTFSDVDAAKEAKLAEAVSLASSLGIIDGFPDGTFGPEKGVTRAQMAKMLVIAKGWEQIASGVSTFSDTKGHWAEGFIALATELGIIDGYPDGSFKPDAPVSYTHAVVMMMRTLGYTNESLNGGKSTAYNEAAYKTKGLSLGLFDVMPSSLVAPANRGDIAMMIQTLLHCALVETNEFGRPAAILVVGKDGKLVDKKLITELAPNYEELTVSAKTLTEGHFVDLAPYMFQTLMVYKNEDGKVLYVDGSLSLTSPVVKDKDGNLVLKSKDPISLATTSKEVFFNGAMATAEKTIAPGFIVVYNNKGTAEKPNYEVAGYIRESATTQMIGKAYVTDAKDIDGIQLPVKDKKVDLTKVVVEGAALSLEDIAKNDVVDVYAADGAQFVRLVVTRETVTGKVTKKTSATVFIDGTEYEVSNKVAEANLAFNTEYTFALDGDGCLAFFISEEVAPVETKYALVTANIGGTAAPTPATLDSPAGYNVSKYPMVRLLLADGTTKDLEVAVKIQGTEGSATTTGSAVIAPTVGKDGAIEFVSTFGPKTVVSYTLDKAGRVVLTPVTMKSNDCKVTSANFRASENTVFFVNKGDAAKPAYAVVTKDDLRTDKAIELVSDNDKAWNVVLLKDASQLKSAQTAPADAKFAVIAGYAQLPDDVYEFTLLVDGAEVVYNGAIAVPATTGTAIGVYTYTLDGNKNLAALNEVTPVTTNMNYEVKADASTSMVDNYVFAENATVYMRDANGAIKVISRTDIVKGAKITVYQNANDYVEVVVIESLPTN